MIPSPEGRPEETDLELINRWKAGDSRAATQLVGRHSQALARFAASAGEREGIEELVQDTFVRAFASLDSFRGESSLRTWLITIERRLMLDRRRAEQALRDRPVRSRRTGANRDVPSANGELLRIERDLEGHVRKRLEKARHQRREQHASVSRIGHDTQRPCLR